MKFHFLPTNISSIQCIKKLILNFINYNTYKKVMAKGIPSVGEL